MKSPLVDVAAILMCMLLIVLIGQYYIHKKEKALSDKIETVIKRGEDGKRQVEITSKKFEVLVKRTE